MTLRAEAENPETAPERLRELVTRGLGVRVAGNPNTPPDLLLRLAARHFDEFAVNPVLPLLLLENPGFCLQIPKPTLRRLLRRTDLPATFLQTLQRHPDLEVRDAARLHVGLFNGENWQEEAADSLRSLQAKQGIVRNFLTLGAVPANLLESLAGSARPALRQAVYAAICSQDDPEARALKSLLRAAGIEPPTPQRPTRMELEMAADDLDRLARGGPWARRQAANHHLTRPATLQRLVRDRTAAVQRAALRNPKLPVEALWNQAAAGSPVSRRTVARNLSAPATLLQHLAQDPDVSVRQAVAAHPEVSAETLAQLATDVDIAVRKTVIRHRSTSVETLKHLAKDAHEGVRKRLVTNRNTPMEVMESLARDPSPEVRGAVGRMGMVSRETFARLFADTTRMGYGDVGDSLRSNKRIPEPLRFRLMRSPQTYEEAMRVLKDWEPAPDRPPRPRRARRPWRPMVHYWHEQRSQENWDIIHSLRQENDPSRLRDLATHEDYGVREGVARNHATPEEVGPALARDPHPDVRKALAARKETPTALLAEMRGDSDYWVRMYVAKREGMDEKVLEELSTDVHRWVRGAVARNISTPVHLLRRLVEDEDAEVKTQLAWNDAVPPDVLERMANDPKPGVRRVSARHAAMPTDCLIRLLESGDVETLTRATENASLPLEWQRRLAQHEDDEVRGDLAGNTALGDEIIALLARDPSAQVRQALARREKLPLGIVEQLAEDTVIEVLETVAGRKGLSPALLERLAQSPHASVRTRVISHDAAPLSARREALARLDSTEHAAFYAPEGDVEGLRSVIALLKPGDSQWHTLAGKAVRVPELWDELVAHPDPQVRGILAGREEAPPDLLARMAEDKEPQVRGAVARNPRTPAAVLEKLAFESEFSPVWGILHNAHLPVDVLRRMALTERRSEHMLNLIRKTAASHRQMPLAALEEIARAEFASVAKVRGRWSRRHRRTDGLIALLGRKELPMAWFEAAIEIDDPEIRQVLLERDDLPSGWRTRILQEALRRSAERNALLPRLIALMHPACEIEYLARFATNGRWIERYSVTQNAAASDEVLERLATDSNAVVRMAAQARLDGKKKASAE